MLHEASPAASYLRGCCTGTGIHQGLLDFALLAFPNRDPDFMNTSYFTVVKLHQYEVPLRQKCEIWFHNSSHSWNNRCVEVNGFVRTDNKHGSLKGMLAMQFLMHMSEHHKWHFNALLLHRRDCFLKIWNRIRKITTLFRYSYRSVVIKMQP